MILTGREGNHEVRSALDAWPGWLANPLSVPPPGWRAGIRVDADEAAGVPAAGLAVRLAAEAIAGLDFDVFVGDDADRREITSTWQARFFDEGSQPNPDESWQDVWSQTEASMTAENNAYWQKVKNAGRVVAVRVIDPCLVMPKRLADGSKVFEVRTATGKKTLDEATILHFRGIGAPGAPAAPSPISVYLDALGAAVARQRYETGFYDRGAGQALAVTFPDQIRPNDVQEYRRQFQSEHGGIGNQHKVRVFGGGVKVDTIGLSPRDAQFIEAQQFTVEDIARIYNVTASKLGGGAARSGGNPLTPEHEDHRWLMDGVAPRARRLQAAVRRDPDFFGPASRAYPMFVTDGFVVGDLATEDLIAHQQIQDGRLTVNEWRSTKGREPVDGGDVPQFTPVGGATNPDSLTPAA